MTAGTARRKGRVNHSTARGTQILWELSEPVTLEDGTDTRFVVTSAVQLPFGLPAETLVFAADSDGAITSFTDLEGSFRGGLDHERAIRGLGFEVES